MDCAGARPISSLSMGFALSLRARYLILSKAWSGEVCSKLVRFMDIWTIFLDFRINPRAFTDGRRRICVAIFLAMYGLFVFKFTLNAIKNGRTPIAVVPAGPFEVNFLTSARFLCSGDFAAFS